eukprot:349587-Chlamydomonas_euryale.AAC.1
MPRGRPAAAAAAARARSLSPPGSRHSPITSQGSPPSRAVSHVLQALDQLHAGPRIDGAAASPAQERNLHPGLPRTAATLDGVHRGGGGDSRAVPRSPSSTPSPHARSPHPYRHDGGGRDGGGRDGAAEMWPPRGVAPAGAPGRFPVRAAARIAESASAMRTALAAMASPGGRASAASSSPARGGGAAPPSPPDAAALGSSVPASLLLPRRHGGRGGGADGGGFGGFGGGGVGGGDASAEAAAAASAQLPRPIEEASALYSVAEAAGADEAALRAALRAAGRREELLRSTVASQQYALRDKDDMVDALRARLSTAQAAAAAAADERAATDALARAGGIKPCGGVGGERAQQVAAENVELAAANTKLSAQVRQGEGSVRSAFLTKKRLASESVVCVWGG